MGGGEDGELSHLYAHALLRLDLYKIGGEKNFFFFQVWGSWTRTEDNGKIVLLIFFFKS